MNPFIHPAKTQRVARGIGDLPAAATTTAWPAARPIRRSARAADRCSAPGLPPPGPNFTAEPSICRTAPGRLAMKASVRLSPCERLTATVHGSPGPGTGRVWIGLIAPGHGFARYRHALGAAADQPRPEQPQRRAPTMPSTGTPLVTSARLNGVFVAAGDEFLGAVRGSIRKKLPP